MVPCVCTVLSVVSDICTGLSNLCIWGFWDLCILGATSYVMYVLCWAGALNPVCCDKHVAYDVCRVGLFYYYHVGC